jgi:2-dehydro-3-deoxygluconokinase
MENKVVCFGEIMLRLSPLGYERFTQSKQFDVVYGGGEANVSVSLANFDIPVSYVTKVPNNPIGQSAINSLRAFGVDTSNMLRGGSRLGIYYMEKGFSQRPSKVVYDRAYSSISEASETDFNWEEIFKNASWFHFTGITPALGENVAKITQKACEIAKKMGLTISCDLNYRKNLWTSEEAANTMSKLMKYVDVCIANEEDAEKVFGIKSDKTDVSSGQLDYDSYKYVASELVKRFGFKKVAITLRSSISACDNKWSAMIYNGENYFFSKEYLIHIVDRVGGGDSFGAGLIYSLIKKYDDKDAIEFAVAASCLKHTIEGDLNHVTVAETKSLMKGDATGRIKR